MRNILDKVKRELAVTKQQNMPPTAEGGRRGAALQEQHQQGFEEPPHQTNLRGRAHHSEEDYIQSKQRFEHDYLRGRKLVENPPQGQEIMLVAKEEDGSEALGNHDNAIFDHIWNTEQSPPVLDPTSNITSSDSSTTIGSGIVGDHSSHRLDVGAWFLMVLIVALAALGIVSWRGSSSLPRRRRRGSNDYLYKGMTMPALSEDDWGAEY